MGGISAKLVVRAPTFPTNAAAQQALRAASVTVVPDIRRQRRRRRQCGLCHGVPVFAVPFRDRADLQPTVSHKLRANTAIVLAEAEKLDSTTHHAARSLAQSRVRRAMELRGKPRSAQPPTTHRRRDKDEHHA